MCGYRIFGIKHHILQDYSDDREYGGGRQVLHTLKDQKAFNIAVFVVRYKAGENIGGMQFQIVAELTKLAISKIPSALDYSTDFQHGDRVLCEALQYATTSEHIKKKKNGVRENNPRGRRYARRGGAQGVKSKTSRK